MTYIPGGGISQGRFLPIDPSTTAQSVVITAATPVSGGVFTPTGQPWGSGTDVQAGKDSFGWSNTHPPTVVSDSFSGFGTGLWAIPAQTQAIQVPRIDTTGDLNCFLIKLPTSGTGLHTPPVFRVELVYSNPADSTLGPRHYFEIRANSYDYGDGRAVQGQIGEIAPLEWTDDPNDGQPLWADGGNTAQHNPATFTVPQGTSHLSFVAHVHPSWKPTGTDADLGIKIHYIRVTPVLNGTSEGEMFIEQPMETVWVWDTSVGAASGQAGTGWYKVAPGRIISSREFVANYTFDGPCFLGETVFDKPLDLINRRLGVAVNDRSPLILTATIPASGSAQTINMTIAGLPVDTSLLPFIVPNGLDYFNGRFVAYTSHVDGAMTLNPTLTVTRTTGATGPGAGTGGTSATFATLSGFGILDGSSPEGPGATLISNNQEVLLQSDRLKFVLNVPASANVSTVHLVLTLYLGGLSE